MDPLDSYRSLIKRIINDYAAFSSRDDAVETEAIFDEVHDHYELIHTGWRGIRRVHGSVIHVDLRNGKIWIQHDGTEDGIANELLAAGVPRDHIVLAFQHPDERKYTDFAAA